MKKEPRMSSDGKAVSNRTFGLSHHSALIALLLTLATFMAQPVTAASDFVAFSDAAAYKITGNATAVAAGKFNTSGYHDFVYAVGGSISYMRSDGSGRGFYSYTDLNTGKNIQKLWAADVSGDGYDDLIALDNAHYYYVFITKPGGPSGNPFNAPTTHTFNYSSKGEGDSYGAQDLAFGDFDGDGDLDIAVATMDVYSPDVTAGDEEGEDDQDWLYTGNFAIALNQGGGVFPQAVNIEDTWAYASGSDAEEVLADLLSRVTAGDFNGDGHIDLAFGYHTLTEWLTAPDAKIVPGNGSGSFDMSKAVATGHGGCEDVDAFIANGSGLGKIPPTNQKAYLAIAFTSSTYVMDFDTTWGIYKDQEIESTPRGPMGQAGDYNQDGQADLLFTDGHSSQLTVGWNWSSWDGSQRHDYDLHLGTDIQQGASGDFDGDGKPDIVGSSSVTDSDKDDVRVYFNDTTPAVLFYKDNNCEGDYIGTVSATKDGTYNLTDSNPPVKNDQARSMKLSGVAANTTITVYDSPTGDTSDDWSTLVTHNPLDDKCIDSFEITVTGPDYTQTFYEHSGHSISVNDLDGKVSRIVIDVP